MAGSTKLKTVTSNKTITKNKHFINLFSSWASVPQIQTAGLLYVGGHCRVLQILGLSVAGARQQQEFGGHREGRNRAFSASGGGCISFWK